MIERRLDIHPQSFDVPQRIAALEKASEYGVGVRMEVWTGHTEFYADANVATGVIEVWAVREYKGHLHYDRTLSSASDDWEPPTLGAHTWEPRMGAYRTV